MAPCRLTSCNVTGLAEGETYQFRVRAFNAAGEGPPSGGCEPVTCRPFVEPPGKLVLTVNYTFTQFQALLTNLESSKSPKIRSTSPGTARFKTEVLQSMVTLWNTRKSEMETGVVPTVAN